MDIATIQLARYVGHMHPILWKIGPITLRWYGVLVAIGFLAAYWLFRKRAASSLKEKDASNIVILMFVTGVLGARLYYVIWNWKRDFSDKPIAEVFMIHHGGLVFLGGFFAACFALWVWCRIKNQSFAEMADLLAPSLALGHALGRLGCFMNGCCYGFECDYPWAVRPDAPFEVAGKAIHPTQIYEFLGLLNIVATLLVLSRIRRYPGQIALAYCLLYSILRFFVEFWRGDVSHHFFGRFTLAQVFSMGLFLFAWFTSSYLAYRAAKVRIQARKKAAATSLSNELSK
jgi:phosphatidylglycerol---prolipoprotein diacylglyceryl transferase